MWELYPSIWKTESAFMAWIRGGVRRGLWEKHPVKLTFIKNNRIMIPNPNPRGKKKEVWGGRCAITGKLFIQTQLEVDHKQGGHSLKKFEDIAKFIEGIIYVTEDELQFISKEAHRTKSYSDRMGIDFNVADAERKAILLIKDKKDVDFLKDVGIIPGSNQAKRRAQIVKYLLEQK